MTTTQEDWLEALTAAEKVKEGELFHWVVTDTPSPGFKGDLAVHRIIEDVRQRVEYRLRRVSGDSSLFRAALNTFKRRLNDLDISFVAEEHYDKPGMLFFFFPSDRGDRLLPGVILTNIWEQESQVGVRLLLQRRGDVGRTRTD